MQIPVFAHIRFEAVFLRMPIELLKLCVQVVQVLVALAATPGLPWHQGVPVATTAAASLLPNPPV